MPAAYASLAAPPKQATARAAYRNTQICVLIDALRALWPAKTAAELSIRTGRSVRTCERWVATRSGLDAEAVAALLRDEDGLQILEALIGEARPEWWRDFRRKVAIGQLIREQDELERRLDALKRD